MNKGKEERDRIYIYQISELEGNLNGDHGGVGGGGSIPVGIGEDYYIELP